MSEDILEKFYQEGLEERLISNIAKRRLSPLKKPWMLIIEVNWLRKYTRVRKVCNISITEC